METQLMINEEEVSESKLTERIYSLLNSKEIELIKLGVIMATSIPDWLPANMEYSGGAFWLREYPVVFFKAGRFILVKQRSCSTGKFIWHYMYTYQLNLNPGTPHAFFDLDKS